jgi:hypothetical protein
MSSLLLSLLLLLLLPPCHHVTELTTTSSSSTLLIASAWLLQWAAHFGAPSSHSPTATPTELEHKVGGGSDAAVTSYG